MRSINVFIVMGILLLCSTGCHCSRTTVGSLPTSRLGSVNLDMHKEDALELLGQPMDAATRLLMHDNAWTPHEYWCYRNPVSGARFVVVFRDAKVVEYGPLRGERAIDLDGMFDHHDGSTESPDDDEASDADPVDHLE